MQACRSRLYTLGYVHSRLGHVQRGTVHPDDARGTVAGHTRVHPCPVFHHHFLHLPIEPTVAECVPAARVGVTALARRAVTLGEESLVARIAPWKTPWDVVRGSWVLLGKTQPWPVTNTCATRLYPPLRIALRLLTHGCVQKSEYGSASAPLCARPTCGNARETNRETPLT